MKRNIIGKQINEFAAKRNDLPNYFGDKFSAPMDAWERPLRRINGEFMANKYNSILELIETTQATVIIETNCIYINYTNGKIKICRDLLIDTFLLPQLKKTA